MSARPTSHITLRKAALWAALWLMTGCGESCGGADSPTDGFSLGAQERDDTWCAEPDQKVLASGYCGCVNAGQRYDEASGRCEACAPSCDGKVCGEDGCGGSCGECGAGLRCAQGACEACAPSCEGKTCGDDGCGGSCGECPAPADPNIITDCTCVTAPPGAYPGATRYAPQCGSGYARFELCGGACGGGSSWREVCVDSFACNQVVAGCSCAPIPGQYYYDGATVPASMCDAQYAVIRMCWGLWCAPNAPAWGAVCGC